MTRAPDSELPRRLRMMVQAETSLRSLLDNAGEIRDRNAPDAADPLFCAQRKPPRPLGLNPSAKFIQTLQDATTGAIIDKFEVVRQITQPGQQVDYETKEVLGLAAVNGKEETVHRTIQVPRVLEGQNILEVNEFTLLHYERKSNKLQVVPTPHDYPADNSNTATANHERQYGDAENAAVRYPARPTSLLSRPSDKALTPAPSSSELTSKPGCWSIRTPSSARSPSSCSACTLKRRR